MFYSIRHITRFRYSGPVHESVMELRMQPRSEAAQTLCNFQISTNPRAQLDAYTDHYGNAVYHFNVLRQHSELRVDATSVVEVKDQEPLPNATDTLEWQRYNNFNLTGEHYDLLEESEFAKSSPEPQALHVVAQSGGTARRSADSAQAPEQRGPRVV